jgi:hypothetical protein
LSGAIAGALRPQYGILKATAFAIIAKYLLSLVSRYSYQPAANLSIDLLFALVGTAIFGVFVCLALLLFSGFNYKTRKDR